MSGEIKSGLLHLIDEFDGLVVFELSVVEGVRGLEEQLVFWVDAGEVATHIDNFIFLFVMVLLDDEISLVSSILEQIVDRKLCHNAI